MADDNEHASNDSSLLVSKFEALKTITHIINKTKTPTHNEILNVKYWFYMLVKERLILDPFAVTDLIDEIEVDTPPATKIKSELLEVQQDLLPEPCTILDRFLPLSRNAKRLFLMMILQPDSQDNGKTKIKYTSYSRAFNTDNASREMREAISDLHSNSNVTGKNEATSLVTSYAELQDGITVHHCQETVDNLREVCERLLPANFLKEVGGLKSSHAMGLLIMLALAGNKKVTYSVDDIIQTLFLPKSFLLSSNLRNKFLKPACEDITKNSAYAVSFDEAKKGHRVNSVSDVTFHLKG